MNGIRAEFDQISSNKIEPEFAISEKNEFYLIYDESKEGKQRYAGLIDQACMWARLVPF